MPNLGKPEFGCKRGEVRPSSPHAVGKATNAHIFSNFGITSVRISSSERIACSSVRLPKNR
jgi:hypothetical protein